MDEPMLDIEESKNPKDNRHIDDLKSAVTILVHFKYILLYVKEHFFLDIEYKIDSFAPQLRDDLDLCNQKYTQLIESSKYLDFIRTKENNYQINSTVYNSFNNQVQLNFVQQQQPSTGFIQDFVLQSYNESSNSNEVSHNSINKTINNETCSYTLSQIKNVHGSLDEIGRTELLPVNICQPIINEKAKFKRPKWTPSNKISPNKIMKTNEIQDGTQDELFNLENDQLLQVEYWCSFEGCRFKCKDLELVKAHEQRRHVNPVQKCSKDGCDETFDTKEELEKHVVDIHYPSTSTSRAESSNNISSKFKCEIEECEQEFHNEFKLKQHWRTMHKDVYLTCKFCEKKFKTRQYMIKHLRYKHGHQVRLEDKKKKEQNTASVESDDNQVIKCTINGCNQIFPKNAELKVHMREAHTDIYLTCKFCDRKCKTRRNLNNHIWIMHQEGDFKCSVKECEFRATLKKDMLSHKKISHPYTRKCTLDGCGEIVRVQRFQRHLSTKHNIRNYICSWPDCGKSFGDNTRLKDHVRVHLNFKRFKCKWPECGYASEQRHTVITHVRVCHFKLPRTKKKQLEMNIEVDEQTQNPCDYVDACREDICI